MSSNRNKDGDMRSGNGYRYKAGNMRFGNRCRASNMRSGNRRSVDRNKNKAGNVKATGKEQDSGHFTRRSARSLRSLRSRPRYEVRS